MEMQEHGLIVERPHRAGRGGAQRVYRFANGYGASVVKSPCSYGFEDGLWELAVLKFNGPGVDDFSLSYDTPVTDDVIGYNTDSDVNNLLADIEALPSE